MSACAYLNIIGYGNCGKSGQTNLIFCMMLPVGVILCMPGQYHIFLPLAAIIAAWRHGMLATRRCRCCTGITAHLSSRAWRSSLWSWGGWLHGPFNPKIFYVVAVWRSYRLLHLGDVALLKEINDYPSTVRFDTIVLVAVVTPEKLPGKWH